MEDKDKVKDFRTIFAGSVVEREICRAAVLSEKTMVFTGFPMLDSRNLLAPDWQHSPSGDIGP